MRRFLRWASLAAVGVATEFMVGCEKQAPPPPPSGPKAESTTQPSEAELAAMRSMMRNDRAAPAAELPAGHPPIGPSTPSSAPALPAGNPSLSVLKLETPADWKSQPPSSSMRRAQYVLPRVEGDAADGELLVFDQRSLGGGGDAESNLARWRGMMKTAGGQPVGDQAVKRESFDANGIPVVMIDVTGRYAPAAMMPGAPQPGAKDDYRMLAAVVQAPGNFLYIRATGPAATMAKHADGFRAMLKAIKP